MEDAVCKDEKDSAAAAVARVVDADAAARILGQKVLPKAWISTRLSCQLLEQRTG